MRFEESERERGRAAGAGRRYRSDGHDLSLLPVAQLVLPAHSLGWARPRETAGHGQPR
jgi:hypothetical protein